MACRRKFASTRYRSCNGCRDSYFLTLVYTTPHWSQCSLLTNLYKRDLTRAGLPTFKTAVFSSQRDLDQPTAAKLRHPRDFFKFRTALALLRLLRRRSPLPSGNPAFKPAKPSRLRWLRRRPLKMDSPPRQPSPLLESPGLSRRQRLWGFAKATRDNYIPRITTSVSLFAQGVTARSIEYDEFGMPVSFPAGTQLTLYPSYSRQIDSSYAVTLRGLIWCPGTMSRKNRFIISLAKQITRLGADEATQLAAVSRLEKESPSDSADEASLSSASVASSSASRDADALLKERLAPFMARTIPNAALTVTVGSESTQHASDLRQISLVSDPNGYFQASIDVPYKPSVVQVTAKADETVCAFQETAIMPMTGVGIISDIDDTVKATGVIGDKRELMRKLLTGDVSSWEIKPVVNWFKTVLSRPNCTFHYVSNSPWQLYTLIQQYFDTVQLPPGSFHLKHYTGNIMASLMEPSSSRKKNALFQVVKDFPQKTFVCIGDSGEKDLEAYVDLSRSNPGRVRAIFIRAVEDSLSDANESRILSEIRFLISNKSATRKAKPAPPLPGQKDEPDLINLSDSKVNLPPMIPKKPKSLQGAPVKKSSPPPLPNRTYLQRTHTEPALKPEEPPAMPARRNVPPPPPPRKTATTSLAKQPSHSSESDFEEAFDVNPYAHGAHEATNYYDLQDYDMKGAQWLQRVTEALQELEGTGTELYFFRDGDSEFFRKSLDCLK